MKRITAYGVSEAFTLTLPLGAKVLHFDFDCGRPSIWVLVDTDQAEERRQFRVVRTGTSIPDSEIIGLVHLGSAVGEPPAEVLHLFEVRS